MRGERFDQHMDTDKDQYLSSQSCSCVIAASPLPHVWQTIALLAILPYSLTLLVLVFDHLHHRL